MFRSFKVVFAISPLIFFNFLVTFYNYLVPIESASCLVNFIYTSFWFHYALN